MTSRASNTTRHCEAARPPGIARGRGNLPFWRNSNEAPRQRTRENLIAIALPVLLLAPFIAKPFHMDDPLFLWLAQHIQTDPIRFFDFHVNWHQSPQPMYEVTMNPPGAGYLIAAAASIVGWSAIALHTVFLAVAAIASWGTCAVARECGVRPVPAALFAVLCPVFLISSTNVMSDTLILALYTWAVAFWMQGLRAASTRRLLVSVTLIAIGFLVKYLALTLIPLLAAYSIALQIRDNKPRADLARLALLLLPLTVVVAYHFITLELFGRSMILGAADFSTGHVNDDGGALMRFPIALAFTGGCFAPVIIAAALGQRRDRIVAAMFILLALLALVTMGRLGNRLIHPDDGIRVSFLVQSTVWIASGALLLYIATVTLVKNRDPVTLLLALWIGGIFVFTAWINWTINGRTLLLMTPAVGILSARHFDFDPKSRRFAAAAMLSAALALFVTWGDYTLARNQRDLAEELVDHAPTRFQGHWGFQYYAEAAGLKHFDRETGIRPDDIIAILENSPSIFQLPQEIARKHETIERGGEGILNTMHRETGAGFYSHFWGPLPFHFGPTPPERVTLYTVQAPQ